MERSALTRSPDGLVAGVCAGIAEYLGWSASVVRTLYVALSLLSAAFPGLLVYLILWVVMPKRERPRRRFGVGGRG